MSGKPTVILDEHQAAACAYWVREATSRRRLRGEPVREAAVTALLAALGTTAPGTGTVSATAQSGAGDDLIGTAEAARILGCSTRRVRQITTDLDARRVGGGWTFHRAHVIAYRDAKHEGTHRNGRTRSA